MYHMSIDYFRKQDQKSTRFRFRLKLKEVKLGWTILKNSFTFEI